MNTTASFPALLQGFFTRRLMQQRQASPHTIASYRDTFRLLLHFAQSRLGHESLETTQIYLDANLALKEAALGKVQFTDAMRRRYRPDDQLMAFLKAL